MDINFELYKVFYYVGTTLNFSETSRQLFISQSAVSQSIKTLERRLGQTLFSRSTKKVQLTPAGQILLKHIEPAVNLIQRGENQLSDIKNSGLGQLHIGATDTICRYLLVPYLKRFHIQFPAVPIKVTNTSSLNCADLLEQGKVDLIVTNGPNARLNHSYVRKTIAVFHDVFIANPAFFQFESEEISFQELKRHPILMLEQKSATSAFLHNLFLKHMLELVPEIELNSNDLLIDLARIGLGIAFIPDYCLAGEDPDLVVLRTREEIPARHVVASVNTGLPTAVSTEEFLKLLPEA